MFLRFSLSALLKTSFCLLVLFAFTYLTQAQSPALATTIKGKVVDSLKNTPLALVTVSLIEYETKNTIKKTITKEDGSFELKGMVIKKYSLSFSAVGIASKTIELIAFPTNGSAIIDAGIVLLTPLAAGLDEVVVKTAIAKPIIKQEVDRISYNVQSDPENVSNTVLEMLRKVPMVSIDGSDNIKLKGSGNFKILINGKPSAMIAKNPSDVFKSMPASNIERIEVITTPPAKYDAEGLAGIINIITKSKIGEGYNGNLSTRYNTAYGSGVNFNGTLKQGKVGLSGYMGYNKWLKEITTQNTYSNSTYSPIVSSLNQGNSNAQGNNNFYGSAELSYEIDTLNLFTGSIETFNGKNKNTILQHSLLKDAGQSTLQQFALGNDRNNHFEGTDLALNYQIGFKADKDRLLTASYKYSSQLNDQKAETRYSQRFNYATPDFNQANNSGNKEHTAQIDYVHPHKKLNIEAGLKGIFRNNFSDFIFEQYDSVGKGFVALAAQTNNFSYLQNIYSGYNSYELKLTEWVAKAGLRLEHTTVDAHFSSLGSNSVSQNYQNLVPSFSLLRKFKASYSINFGYSQRIERPGIWQLNPFVDKTNPQSINYGNPDLKPVTNHSFEMNYSNFKKGSLNIGLSYTMANNTIENVTFIRTDTVSASTFQNAGKNRGLGLTLNSNYPITKKLNIDVNAQLLHVWLTGVYLGELYSNKGFQGHCFVNTGYQFEKGFHAGFDIGYDSRYVLLQGKDNEYFSISLSGSKDFLNKKATISIYLSDPFFDYRNMDSYSSSSTFSQRNTYQNVGRRGGISFRYKFGKFSGSIKKNERGISNNDVSGGRR